MNHTKLSPFNQLRLKIRNHYNNRYCLHKLFTENFLFQYTASYSYVTVQVAYMYVNKIQIMQAIIWILLLIAISAPYHIVCWYQHLTAAKCVTDPPIHE